MLKTRRCDICKTRLSGKKGHGFVVNNGKSVVCGDYKRHARLKAGRKWSYAEDKEKVANQDAETEG